MPPRFPVKGVFDPRVLEDASGAAGSILSGMDRDRDDQEKQKASNERLAAVGKTLKDGRDQKLADAAKNEAAEAAKQEKVKATLLNVQRTQEAKQRRDALEDRKGQPIDPKLGATTSPVPSDTAQMVGSVLGVGGSALLDAIRAK